MLQLILQRIHPNYTGLQVLFEVSEPLMYSFEIDSQKYLLYVLQNRSTNTEKGIATIYEAFIGESSQGTLNDLLNAQISILEALSMTSNKQVVGFINGRLYPVKSIADLDSITHKVPENDIFLPKTSNRKHWCESCNSEIDFDRNKDFVIKTETLTFKGETVSIPNTKTPICSVCKSEITDEEMDSAIMKAALEVWEKQTGTSFSKFSK